MTNKKNYLILFPLIIILGLVIFLRNKDELHVVKVFPGPKPYSEQKIDTKNLSIDGKKVMGLTPGNAPEEIKKLRVANYVSPNWETLLENSIREQGGQTLKEVQLTKIDSFIWPQNGIALHVESVLVNLTKNNNEKTSFKVLVDAQNGKILKNWDQPVIENMNPKDQFKVRIDPRYHDEN